MNEKLNQKRLLDFAAGVKYDVDKPNMSLLSSVAIEELTKVLDFGAKKYAAHNWRNGISTTRLVSAALRHTFSFLRGETYDPETGLHHMAHAMCCCMFIIELHSTKPELDDRYVIVSAPPEGPAVPEVPDVNVVPVLTEVVVPEASVTAKCKITNCTYPSCACFVPDPPEPDSPVPSSIFINN